jgi:hypothetical protein
MTDTKKYIDLLKLASLTIKQLQAEKLETEANLTKLATANELGFSMYRNGRIAAEDLEKYIQEANKKELLELNLIKEASVFISSDLSTFGLSAKTDVIEKEYSLVNFLLNQ